VTPLGREIRELIAAEGPITLERYMALALGHPRHGYYMTRDPLGAAGDFTTAPEISQMFGELLGLWAAETWSIMGRPSRLRLVELGPGRGTLMSDALRAARIVPGFCEAASVHLVETSPVLRDAQARTLERAGADLFWHASLAEVPAGPAIVIANEFFDALPIRQLVRTETGWHERMVGLGPDGGHAR
jgi:NADH dehydrogenase [ubiquinone] 1 alpha subcomplex assembly factor 7